MPDETETITIQARDLAAMSRKQVRSLVLSIIANAIANPRLKAREVLSRTLELPFVQKYDASETLAVLLESTEDDATTFALAIGALIEVLADPLRTGGVRVESGSPDGERLAEESKTLERAASIVRIDGHDSMAEKLEGMALRRRDRLIPRRTSGATRSIHGELARELERVLLEHPSKLLPSHRRDLIARLLTDFVKPTTARQVTKLLSEARRLDERAAQRADGEALYLRGLYRIDDEPMVEHRDRAPGSFAGLRHKIPLHPERGDGK